jgi:hypothetical protein
MTVIGTTQTAVAGVYRANWARFEATQTAAADAYIANWAQFNNCITNRP